MAYQAYPRYWGMGHGRASPHEGGKHAKEVMLYQQGKKERNTGYIGKQGCLLSVRTGIPSNRVDVNNIWKFLENIWPKEDISWKLFFLLFSLSSLFSSSYSLGFFFSPSFISLRDYNYSSLGSSRVFTPPLRWQTVNHPQKPQANVRLLSGQCSWDSIETA